MAGPPLAAMRRATRRMTRGMGRRRRRRKKKRETGLAKRGKWVSCWLSCSS
jgi:hypothetical protein